MKSVNSYLDAVKARLTRPEVKKLLQFAKCDPAKCNGPLTSEAGLQQTYDTILTGAKNMFECCQGRDAVAEMVTNFSEGIGYTDVSNVNTVGAIDVTLLARAESLVSYLAIDRALPTPDATVYFQNLVALNNAGGFEAGEIVNGSYVPPTTKTRLGLPVDVETSISADGEVDLSDHIVPGTVKVTLTNGSISNVGGDFTKDGKIYFNGSSVIASIDYATGIVSIEGLSGSGMTAEIAARSDATKDTNGTDIPRVGPQYTNVQLHSIPQNIILENNMLSQMYMNKTYTLATGKSDAPYNDTTFQRVKDVYVEYINKRLLLPMIYNTGTVDSDSLVDLTGYALNDFAYTKNDMISQALNNMNAKLLRNTGVGVTTIVTNSYGAALLMNIPNLFVAAPDANKGLNGLVGYWQGIPVFRHNLLDAAFETANFDGITKAEFIGCYKNPDNNSGSMVYGEFLPFTSTGLVGNFMNPSQVANGYFSQIATEVVQKNLFTRMEVILPVYRGTTSTGVFQF